jgi:PKD repeat protein/photosystem II stability/assembly factor-like uncharacterized protein
MKKITLFLLLSLIFLTVSGQENNNENFDYEIKHKSSAWFQNMKDGADYFYVKKMFEKYFAQYPWEKSKNRNLGESWLKSKIFYLDKHNRVQPEPYTYKNILNQNRKLNKTTDSVGTWRILGPVNSAETNYSGKGNHGGYVYLCRIDPTNTNKFFVSYFTGGLWMTQDNGNIWTLVDTNMPDEKYLDLDVALSNPQIVYAISQSHVIKSQDGGLHWEPTTLTVNNYAGKAYDIAVSPTNENIVVARWGNNLYKTADGGSTWTQVETGLPGIPVSGWSSIGSEVLDFNVNITNEVYTVVKNQSNKFSIYKSSDSGDNFNLFKEITLDPSLNGQVIGWIKLLFPSSATDAFYVFVGTGTSEYAHKAVHMYKIKASNGDILLERINMINGEGDAYAHDPVLHHGDIDMDYNNENVIIYGSYGNQKVHISTDNGVSFTLSNDITHYDIRSIDIVDSKFIVGNDGELVRSDDMGDNLVTISNSISNHELWGFGSAFKTDLVATGNNHGPLMVKEFYNGYDWYNGPGADQGNTDVNPLDDRYIYSQGYSNYRFFRTGPHQLINEPNMLDLGGTYSYFNTISFHPNNYYTIITHHAGQYPTGNPNLQTWKKSLIKSEDNGNSISVVKTFDDQVFRESICAKNPDYIYVVVGLADNELWYTPDGGVTWNNITPPATITQGNNNITDIAVSDENPNEIWVSYGGVQSTCKIIKSDDSGNNWTNLTQPVLTDFPVTKILFQRGTDGGIYLANKAGVFYKNNNMSDWVALGSGLVQAEIRFMFINYNQNLLKIGTSRGAFEHTLYEVSPPSALVAADKKIITCPIVETVQFKDYSVLRNSSATWQWTFEGGNPSTSTEENPVVSYANAPDGLYDVSLTVTDDYGSSSITLSDFIEVNNQCGTAVPEVYPGNLASVTGADNNDFLELDNINIDKSNFTFSCWIKPNGTQEDYSCIFAEQDATTSALMLNFRDGNNTLGFHPDWSWSSGLQTPPGEWSHVALVSDGSQVKIYVNGEEASRNSALSGIINKLDIGRYGNGWGNRYANFEIDEVSIWNRALTIDEIRKWRHLIKTDTSDPIFNGLQFYFQFNESQGDLSINKGNAGGYIKYMGSTSSRHNISTAPVFDGVSEKAIVNQEGLYDFSLAKIKMYFAQGVYPDGDLWVFKSNISPDSQPPINSTFNTYYVVNNYGANSTFTSLDSISFGHSDYIIGSPSAYHLFKRNSNAYGDTWGDFIDKGDHIDQESNDVYVTFSTDLNIDSFSQFVIGADQTLSAENIEIQHGIEVFPNPLSRGETFHVVLEDIKEPMNMSVFNMEGKQVAYVKLTKIDNQIRFNLPKGVYLLKLFSTKENYSYKLLIK